MLQKTENTLINLHLVLSTLTQRHQFVVIFVSQNLAFDFKKHCGNVKVNYYYYYFVGMLLLL